MAIKWRQTLSMLPYNLLLHPRHQFLLPANLRCHSRLPYFQQDGTISLLNRRTRRHESHQTYSSLQLVSHLGTSTTLFPAIWTKTERSIGDCFLNEQGPREQAAINELTKKTSRRHATITRRWPGFDKGTETKLRLDVYTRPWPPGWSFLRRIYTSRGSERVNC